MKYLLLIFLLVGCETNPTIEQAKMRIEALEKEVRENEVMLNALEAERDELIMQCYPQETEIKK